MNCAVARHMIGAEVRKLVRHGPTMMTASVLSLGITALYLAVIWFRAEGAIGGAQALSSGSTLLGAYFGSFTAMFVGTMAGTIDLNNGVFRDLVATGRSRTALYLIRIPAAIFVALAFNLGGFLLTVVTALALSGDEAAPSAGTILEFGGWVILATTVVTILSVGVASLTGSTSLTLTALIGWQTVASTLLYGAAFLGPARNALLAVALGYLRPGPAIGGPDLPGNTNTLAMLTLPMPAIVAVLVIVAWAVVPTIAGAWRVRTQDA